MKKKLTRFDLQNMKKSGETIVWVTSYDYWTAQFGEKAGMDMILVGDSLGMCIYGCRRFLTMDQCIYHSGGSRGAQTPVMETCFLSYHECTRRSGTGRFSRGESRCNCSKEAEESARRSKPLLMEACWS
jgi:3-methyl-2-oxobutanoate hydroxymethyltransferase